MTGPSCAFVVQRPTAHVANVILLSFCGTWRRIFCRIREIDVRCSLFVLLLLAAITASAGPPILDVNFGNHGIASIDLDILDDNGLAVRAATITPDGKLLFGGHVATGINAGGSPSLPLLSRDFAIVRLLANGTRDTAFGSNGRALLGVVPTDGLSGNLVDLATDAAGRVTYAGSWRALASSPMVVGRLLADGSADTSFDRDGHRTFDPGEFINSAQGSVVASRVQLQRDGKILSFATVSDLESAQIECMGLVRSNADGSTDTTFGRGGTICQAPDAGPFASGSDFSLLSDGRMPIVGFARRFAGDIPADLAVARVLGDGSLDANFGDRGWTLAPFNQGGGLSETTPRIDVDTWGRIVVTTAVATSQGSAISVVRFLANGVLDTAFGVRGRVLLPSLAAYSSVSTLKVRDDGRILLAGTSDSRNGDGIGQPGDARGLVALLLPNGQLDTTFGDGGQFSTTAITRISRALLFGNFLYLAGVGDGSDLAVARYRLPVAPRHPVHD